MKLEKNVSSNDSQIRENADLPNFAAINISVSGSANSTSAGNDYKPAKKERRSNSRDLVFRTWTQEMIDNMLITRNNAVAKKKEERGGESGLNMTDIWYEFLLFLNVHTNFQLLFLLYTTLG